MMVGGGGDDRFLYLEASEIAPGESIDGGAGTGDAIVVHSSGEYHFTGIWIFRVERLVFAMSDNVVVNLRQDQIGTGAIVAVDGTAGANVVRVSGFDVDLTDVVFNTW